MVQPAKKPDKSWQQKSNMNFPVWISASFRLEAAQKSINYKMKKIIVTIIHDIYISSKELSLWNVERRLIRLVER